MVHCKIMIIEIEKEFYQAFPCGDDITRSKRLQQSILKQTLEGRLG